LRAGEFLKRVLPYANCIYGLKKSSGVRAAAREARYLYRLEENARVCGESERKEKKKRRRKKPHIHIFISIQKQISKSHATAMRYTLLK
jgi:hypothetical protein